MSDAVGFNPLTRIRSSLTLEERFITDRFGNLFQSPHEDSFFSDRKCVETVFAALGIEFQSPHEDSFFSDANSTVVGQFIPQTAFQSPHEDSFFSDLGFLPH